MQNYIPNLNDLVNIASGGKASDVDILMKHLENNQQIVVSKLIDFALGNVKNECGIKRIEHYLFNGSQLEKNQAALFFKRNGNIELLKNAVDAGAIDTIIAFSK